MLSLVDKWDDWHSCPNQFQCKYSINDPNRCMGDFEGDEKFAIEFAKHWNQWLCISQDEIASNFGVTSSETGNAFVFSDISLEQHYHDTQSNQHSGCCKLRAHRWALRRVQEVKALCLRQQWAPFQEHRHLGSELKELAMKGHR